MNSNSLPSEAAEWHLHDFGLVLSGTSVIIDWSFSHCAPSNNSSGFRGDGQQSHAANVRPHDTLCLIELEKGSLSLDKAELASRRGQF